MKRLGATRRLNQTDVDGRDCSDVCRSGGQATELSVAKDDKVVTQCRDQRGNVRHQRVDLPLSGVSLTAAIVVLSSKKLLCKSRSMLRMFSTYQTRIGYRDFHWRNAKSATTRILRPQALTVSVRAQTKPSAEWLCDGNTQPSLTQPPSMWPDSQ